MSVSGNKQNTCLPCPSIPPISSLIIKVSLMFNRPLNVVYYVYMQYFIRYTYECLSIPLILVPDMTNHQIKQSPIVCRWIVHSVISLRM